MTPASGNGTLLITEDERIVAAAGEAEVVVQAIDVLERDEHDVVILDHHSDPDSVAYLRSLSGARRRDLTVVLVSEETATGDRDLAWRESVDVVINSADLDRFDALLQEAVWDKGRFYERFRQIANAEGEN